MGKRLPRQEPRQRQTDHPDPLAGLDGLLIHGRDPGAAHRRRIREANAARQDGERWLRAHPPQSA